MHTEEEARKKWCPFARVLDGGGADNKPFTATNRHAGHKIGKDGKLRILRGNSMCIASECMAWRTRGSMVGQEWVVSGGVCGLAGS